MREKCGGGSYKTETIWRNLTEAAVCDNEIHRLYRMESGWRDA
ncbi:MAG: hypothetical protein ACLUOI_08510 [Eisenbergiella sp.]